VKEESSVSEQIELQAKPEPVPIHLDDATTDAAAHDRYLDALHDLVQDAAAAGRLHLFADVLAWTFARLAINCGPAATADLLAKVGKYMGALEEQNRAQRELEAAREEGAQLN
jgi:hypothetical protein